MTSNEQETVKMTLLGREPVMFLALVQTALALGVGFGIDMTLEQIGLVLGFSAAVLGFLARSQVTPMEALPEIMVEDIGGQWPPQPVRRDGPPPDSE